MGGPIESLLAGRVGWGSARSNVRQYVVILSLPPAAVTRAPKAGLSIRFPPVISLAKYAMHRPRSDREGDAEGCEPAPPGAGGAAEAAAA